MGLLDIKRPQGSGNKNRCACGQWTDARGKHSGPCSLRSGPPKPMRPNSVNEGLEPQQTVRNSIGDASTRFAALTAVAPTTTPSAENRAEFITIEQANTLLEMSTENNPDRDAVIQTQMNVLDAMEPAELCEYIYDFADCDLELEGIAEQTTNPELLDAMGVSLEPDVVLAVMNNPHTQGKTFENMAENFENSLERKIDVAASDDPEAFSSTFHAAMRDRERMYITLMQTSNQNVPDGVTEAAINAVDSYNWQMSSDNTYPTVADFLSRKEDVASQTLAAGMPGHFEKTANRLAESESRVVRVMLAQNRKTTFSVLKKLEKDSDFKVCISARETLKYRYG